MSQPASPDQKLTRKQRRQLKLRHDFALLLTSSDTEEDSDSLTPSTHISPSLNMGKPIPIPIRILVCSIGNPGPYMNTLHSAGHTLLSAVQTSLSYPPFKKSRHYANGLLSCGPEYTLLKNLTVMNESGRRVACAWRRFKKDARGEDARLVIVHDEMESPLGKVKMRPGSASTKGHNGLKSIGLSMVGDNYTRIGVGIGRPESRETGVVVDYVLRKMKDFELKAIVDAAGDAEQQLRRIANGWW